MLGAHRITQNLRGAFALVVGVLWQPFRRIARAATLTCLVVGSAGVYGGERTADSDMLVEETLRPQPVQPQSAIGRLITAQADAFKQSDIEFPRSQSNAPFLPLAYLGGTHYGDAQVKDAAANDRPLNYQQRGVSAGGAIPWLVGPRDALLTAGYVHRSVFSVDGAQDPVDSDFGVTSAALGLGWLRQLNQDWQVVGFVMPFYHDTNLAGGQDYLQTIGGIFGRYAPSQERWWVFGVFADDSPFDTYFLPYAGLSWVLTPEWTISAIMPWPRVIYAPSQNWFVSLGASIGGASWAVDRGTGDIGMDLNAFDFGLEYSHRVSGPLWASVSAGVGGLRSFQFSSSGGSELPALDVTSSPYVRLTLTVRPGDFL
jgi:hypothetical protein